MKSLSAKWIEENNITVKIISVSGQRFARRDKNTGYGGEAVVEIENASTGNEFSVTLDNADTVKKGDVCQGVKYDNLLGSISYGLQKL